MKMLILILLSIQGFCLAETLRFEEDNRTWISVGKAKTDELTFIPEGDSAKDWQEVFILHHELQSKIPLDTYYKNFMQALNKKTAGLFNSKILKSDESSILFEWWMDTDIPNAQHGWVKVFYTEEGLGFMRYTTRNVDLVEKIKPIWETILAKYTVDMIPEKIDVHINWNLDSKTWDRDEGSIERYRLRDSSDQWTEMVTLEGPEHFQESLREYYQAELRKLEEKNTNVNARIIFDTTTRILYEWWYHDGNRTVHVWTFISKENYKAAMIIKHYIISNKNIEARKQIWEKILKNVKVDANYRYVPIRSGNWVGPTKQTDDLFKY